MGGVLDGMFSTLKAKAPDDKCGLQLNCRTLISKAGFRTLLRDAKLPYENGNFLPPRL